jgi:DNA-binding cell septation regulator SpoVG
VGEKMQKKISLIILFLLSLTGFVIGSTLDITNVTVVDNNSNSKRARVIIGSFLAIENIVLYPDKSIKLPQYVSSTKNEYTQVDILDPELEQKIINAILTNDIKENIDQSKDVKISIGQFEKFDTKSKRKANVRVIFNDEIAVICGVMDGKKGLWIAWPAHQEKDKSYRKDIYILKSALQKKVENLILEEYNKENTKN